MLKILGAVILVVAAHAEFGPLFRPKNVSSIAYRPYPNFVARSQYSVVEEGTCFGELKEDFLKENGIARSRLKKGIRCVAGDFDANTFVDFALFTRRGSELALVVIFFEGPKIVRRQLITGLGLGSIPPEKAGIGIYPAGYQGEAGEPRAKSDGLFRWGLKEDERKQFAVWFYNKETQLLEKNLYPYQGD